MGVGAGLYMYDVVVKKFTFAISSPHEFLFKLQQNLSRFFFLRRNDAMWTDEEAKH